MFLISPCTEIEILDIISSLDYNKAVGINSISIKMLKLAKEQIAEHLWFIYNLSFTTGIFPGCLKIAKSHQFTLLSNLDKIIEKLMHERLMGFLNDQKVLYKNNLDFKKNFYCTCSN